MNGEMPDAYTSQDLKPWESGSPLHLTQRLRYVSILNLTDSLDKMSFCSLCGSPLLYALNALTGEIEQKPCPQCHKFLPMDSEEKERFINWLLELRGPDKTIR